MVEQQAPTLLMCVRIVLSLRSRGETENALSLGGSSLWFIGSNPIGSTMKKLVSYNGPYVSPSGTTRGRKYLSVRYDDGSKGTMLYSRFLMTEHLGRSLHPDDETVDHINGDKTDDRIENLQILSRSEHSRKDAKPIEWMAVVCPVCFNSFQTKAARYRHNQLKQGKRGPFCSKTCAGKAGPK